MHFYTLYVIIYDIMDEITKELQSIGLTENESAIYLASLELGKASVLELSKFSGIKRPTTYLALFSLQEKGIVRELKQNGKLRYIPESPKFVLARYKNKFERLENLLPQLQGISSKSENKPKIRYYEGHDGLISIYEDNLLEPRGSELLAFASAEDLYSTVGQYMSDHIKRRVKRKIRARTIATKYEHFSQHFLDNKKELRQLRALKFKDFPFEGEMNIYGNKVSIMSFKNDVIGLIIESQEVADNMRAIFELAWNTATELNQPIN